MAQVFLTRVPVYALFFAYAVMALGCLGRAYWQLGMKQYVDAKLHYLSLAIGPSTPKPGTPLPDISTPPPHPLTTTPSSGIVMT